MKLGRPSKYTKDMPQRAYAILSVGGTHASVCRELDICIETFYAWLGRGFDKKNADC